MKLSSIVCLLAGLGLTTALATAATATVKAKARQNVIVNFSDPDHFTDVQDRHTMATSLADLEELRTHLQQKAAARLAADQLLTVTVLDVDLAGMIRPDKDNLRFLTATTIPRIHLKYELVGADGKVIASGERRLSDSNYQQNIQLIGRNEPLFYDKELLSDWVQREFKRRA